MPTSAKHLEQVVVAVGPERNGAFFLEIGGHFDQQLGRLIEKLVIGREQGVIGPFNQRIADAGLVNAGDPEAVFVGQPFHDGGIGRGRCW